MAWLRPEIISGVTRGTKEFFDKVLDGVAMAHSDVETLELERSTGRLSEAALNATYAPATLATTVASKVSAQQIGALNVTNLAGLTRWGAARGKAITGRATITVPSDSIGAGVGTDGNANEITGPYDAAQQAIYRERAWPVQLRKMLNNRVGVADQGLNWFGFRQGWNSGAVLAGATTSSTLGPFGPYSAGGAGGISIPNGPDTVTLPAASALGKYTEISIPYWGSDAGVASPCAPSVTIDGVAQTVPQGAASGMLNWLAFAGLADTTHEVVIGNSQSGRTFYGFGGCVYRSPTGFVVNRMGRPGATVVDIVGSNTAASKTRLLTSTAMPGVTDLLIPTFGTNDQSQQVPIAEYKSRLQDLIDTQVAGGGCVLLLGSPPAANPTGAITEQMYRDAMKDLALSNQHVAYTDVRSLWGTHAEGYSLGLVPIASTVHPTAKAAGMIATALAELLTLPNYRAA
ncbi:hypothetical protein GS466_24775 [Rhodococcus hoagii]|nr:hypothetical protein [Prescottella equi]